MVCEHLHTSRRARARTLGMCGTQIQPRQPHAPTGLVAGLLRAQGRLQLEGHLPPPRKRSTESGQEDRGHGQEGVSPIVKRATRCRTSRRGLLSRAPRQGSGTCGCGSRLAGQKPALFTRGPRAWAAAVPLRLPPVARHVLLSPSGLHTAPAASVPRSLAKVTEGGEGGERGQPPAFRPRPGGARAGDARAGASGFITADARPGRAPRGPPRPSPPAPGSACQSFPQALERWISANAPAAIPRPRPFLEQLSVPNMCLQSLPVALGRRGSIPRTACRSVSVFIVTIISIRSSTF